MKELHRESVQRISTGFCRWSTAALLAVILCATTGSRVIAQDTTAVVDKILPTLAFVVAPMSADTISMGTAFCFWSTPTKSYFLTNNHVVANAKQVSLRLEFLQDNRLVPARVYRRNTSLAGMQVPNDTDLAILVVDVGHVPHVIFQKYPAPKAGQAIGIAGFPAFRIEGKKNLSEISPSVHFGTVNSLPYRGESTMDMATYFEHDATTDHGNSGGPLFDRRTGVVLGVATLAFQSKTNAVQNNMAMSAETATSFIMGTYLPHAEYFDANNTVQGKIPCLGGTSEYVEARSGGWCTLPDAVTTQ